MKPALTIAELAEITTFGANKLKKAALENLAMSAIVGYEIVKEGKVLRVEVHAPNPVSEESSIRRFLELTKNETNLQFFTDIEEGVYLAQGELRTDAFTDEFFIQYSAKIEEKIGYGTDITLDKVIHSNAGKATLVFSSVKNEVKHSHHATWDLLDVAKDFDKTVVIPRPLYKTYNQFMALLAEALQQPKERFFLKEDPTAVKGDGIDVYINPIDLVYYGKLKISLPYTGATVQVISNSEEPEAPAEPSVAVTDVVAEIQSIDFVGTDALVGDVFNINAFVLPETADQTYTVVIADPAVISKVGDAYVCNAAGTTTIDVVSTADPTIKDTLTITVTVPVVEPTTVTLGALPASVNSTDEFAVSATLDVVDYVPTSVVWTTTATAAIIEPDPINPLNALFKVNGSVDPFTITCTVDGLIAVSETITVVI